MLQNSNAATQLYDKRGEAEVQHARVARSLSGNEAYESGDHHAVCGAPPTNIWHYQTLPHVLHVFNLMISLVNLLIGHLSSTPL
jgi:hypothetical protein